MHPTTPAPTDVGAPPRRPRLSKGLIALNLALALGLGVATLVPTASAERQPTRARGVYSMISGAIQGGNSDAIYVVDSANQEMVVLRWNDGRTTLEGIGYRNLNLDATATPGR